MHWLIIIIGIFLISISISNPFYKLVVKNRIKLNIFNEILIRIFIFLISIVVIFYGLYLESII